MQRYGGAVYHYLFDVLHDADAAEELTQEFALRFVRGDFKRADPERGRFRDFVKAAVYHLLVDHQRRQRRQPQPLPTDSAELPGQEAALGPSDQQFLEHWREAVMHQAWEDLAQMETRSSPPYYTVLRWRTEHPKQPVAQLARQLNAREGRPFTEGHVRQILRRAREKFADFLLEEVSHSLENAEPERLEQELIDLGLFSYCQPALDRRASKSQGTGRKYNQ
jgi:RNA polymerase sigma-70 factor (ECF subfamily)